MEKKHWADMVKNLTSAVSSTFGRFVSCIRVLVHTVHARRLTFTWITSIREQWRKALLPVAIMRVPMMAMICLICMSSRRRDSREDSVRLHGCHISGL